MKNSLFLAVAMFICIGIQPEASAQEGRRVARAPRGINSGNVIGILDYNVKLTIRGEYWDGLPLDFSLTGAGRMSTSFPSPAIAFEGNLTAIESSEMLRVNYNLAVTLAGDIDGKRNYSNHSLTGEVVIGAGQDVTIATNGDRKLNLKIEKLEEGQISGGLEGAAIGASFGVVEGNAEGAVIGASVGVVETDAPEGAVIGGLVSEGKGGFIASGTFGASEESKPSTESEHSNAGLARSIAEVQEQLTALKERLKETNVEVHE
ncbi:MAG: hypothetical protein KDN22_25490 [Verrucomicrobiae bacterium]|nr:hypothetical protein [Verrucomicrobiae bacterium]